MAKYPNYLPKFDPAADFVVRASMTVAGRGLVTGQKFPKHICSTRLLRLMYEQRKIVLAGEVVHPYAARLYAAVAAVAARTATTAPAEPVAAPVGWPDLPTDEFPETRTDVMRRAWQTRRANAAKTSAAGRS